MNRNLLRSVREYKRETFLTPVFVALEVFMEVLIPLLMANIIDVGIAGGNLSYTVKMGLLLVALALIALFFRSEIRDSWAPLPRQAMPKICGMIFFIRCRIFPSEISTTFLPPVW